MACRQLGFDGARGFTETSKTNLTGTSRPSSTSRSMYAVKCRGDEARIQDCAHSSIPFYGRTDFIAGVVCYRRLIKYMVCPTNNATFTIEAFILGRFPYSQRCSNNMQSLRAIYLILPEQLALK